MLREVEKQAAALFLARKFKKKFNLSDDFVSVALINRNLMPCYGKVACLLCALNVPLKYKQKFLGFRNRLNSEICLKILMLT